MGPNNTGQLGQAYQQSQGELATHVTAANFDYVKAISAGIGSLPGGAGGQDFAMALTGSGEVWTWGGNQQQQLGASTSPNKYRWQPSQVGALQGIKAIAAGYRLGLAITGNGRLYSWGRNDEGQAGTGATSIASASPAPRQVGAWTYKLGVGGSGISVFAHSTD